MSSNQTPSVRLPIAPEPDPLPPGETQQDAHLNAMSAFAAAKNIVLSGKFTREQIAEVERTYRVPVAERFSKEWLVILEEAAAHILRDGLAEPYEREFLREFVLAFRVAKSDADAAIKQGGQRALLAAISRATADHDLTDEEWAELQTLARRIGLPPESLQGSYTKVCTTLLADIATRMISDGLISDEEWLAFESAGKRLRVTLSFNEDTKRATEAARERWRILEGPLQGVRPSNVQLDKHELAYLSARVEWHENRKVRPVLSYAGLRGSIPIMKGLSARYGSIRLHMPAVDQMTRIGTGELLMTNSRILFRPDTGDTKQVRWSSVVAINIEAANLFEIERSSGKSPTIRILSMNFGSANNAPLLASRLLRDAKSEPGN